MSSSDLSRCVASQRGDAKAFHKLTLLWRRAAINVEVTGEMCAKNARDPLLRLEPLRRRTGTALRLQ